jgi:hypothetical protein
MTLLKNLTETSLSTYSKFMADCSNKEWLLQQKHKATIVGFKPPMPICTTHAGMTGYYKRLYSWIKLLNVAINDYKTHHEKSSPYKV